MKANLTDYERKNYLLREKKDFFILNKIKELETSRFAFAQSPDFSPCVKQIQILTMLKNSRHAPDFSPRVLDKLSLNRKDQEITKLIRTQLKKDWRKPPINYLNKLAKKYKR